MQLEQTTPDTNQNHTKPSKAKLTLYRTISLRLVLISLLLFNICCFSSDAQGIDSVHMYYYKNSLYNHLETGNSEANQSTNVGNWIARMASQASTPKTATLGSVFGFFHQWSVPPRANNFHSEITTPHLARWDASWDGAENIDLLGFVPDNFDGQDFDPSDTTNMGEAYVVKLLYLIDQWNTNAPNPDRKYIVYAGWPVLNGYGGTNDDPLTITDAQFKNWRTFGLGEYQDWMELLVERLQSARPTLNIKLHNISKALLMCHENTVVKDIEADILFEDLAPHGRSTWYFLAAVAEYIELFGEKPAADFKFNTDWGVDTLVTSSYQDIVNYIWGVLIDETVSIGERQLNTMSVFPNPTTGTISVKLAEIHDFLNVRLISIDGKILDELEFSNTNSFVIHTYKPKGIYMLEIMNQQGKISRSRIVIK